MQFESLQTVYRRWVDGQSFSGIAAAESLDRKTVRRYVGLFRQHGLGDPAAAMPDPDILRRKLADILGVNQRQMRRSDPFLPYLDEIRGYLGDVREPLKAKTAFEVIREKYGIAASYSAFKRFARRLDLLGRNPVPTIRIELPAGEEAQIDYGKVGLLADAEGRRRTVWAFCGLLSCSRLPFVQFVFTQNAVGFVGSHVAMFGYFGGVPHRMNLDNLKAGVLSPDLYDPSLNRSYHDMATHYNVFIDPSRVRRPQDKGKIERFVPSARELFRKLKALHPDSKLEQLNILALKWCRDEYGERPHGTTKLPPRMVFEQTERAALRPLPVEPFEIPFWKNVKVHPDRFVQFDKRYYALPAEYIGQTLNARKSGSLLQLFHNGIRVREYVISEKRRNYLAGDFPETAEAMMCGGWPRLLLQQAKTYGGDAYALIQQILTPHAYLNCRRAQGVLQTLKRNANAPCYDLVVEQAVRKRVHRGDALQNLFDCADRQLRLPYEVMPISATQKDMTRAADYYS